MSARDESSPRAEASPIGFTITFWLFHLRITVTRRTVNRQSTPRRDLLTDIAVPVPT